MNIGLICHRTGYQSRKLNELCGFTKVPWQDVWSTGKRNFDLLINWGVQGKKRRSLIEDLGDPVELGYDVMNWNKQLSKFQAIKLAKELGVPAPHSVIQYQEMNGERDKFIYKPFYSIKGKGIYRADEIPAGVDTRKGYYQRYLEDRRYEVRVTALSWVRPDAWGVWKKEQNNADGIAWNHDQGGKFVRVNDTKLRVFRECMDYAKKIIRGFGWDFGAADFAITGDDKKVWFLELNSRPGFTMGYDGQRYIDWFNMLKDPNTQRGW